MTASALRLGQIVRVTFDAIVREVYGSDEQFTVVAYKIGDKTACATLIRSDDVTFEVLAPAEWPPRAGDLWRDSSGELWFFYTNRADSTDELAGRTANGLRWTVGELDDTDLDINGPWTLVHREEQAGGGSDA